MVLEYLLNSKKASMTSRSDFLLSCRSAGMVFQCDFVVLHYTFLIPPYIRQSFAVIVSIPEYFCVRACGGSSAFHVLL